jgi:hypothetical protein
LPHHVVCLADIYLTISDDISIREPDPDSADVDALGDLLYASSRASTPDQLMDDETPQPNLVDSGSASAVVVEHFPFGRPGAPIPGRPQGDSQAAFTGPQWAPFQSQLDWDVARWVKLRSGSSTAVSELLAIPGVCASNLLYYVSNFIVIGR